MNRIFRSIHSLLAILVAGGVTGAGAVEDYIPPKDVSVLTVFLVPKDEKPPTADEKEQLLKHLKWTQTRYREMLKGRDTFSIAPGEPPVLAAKLPGPAYDAMPEGAAPQLVSEVLEGLHLTRFNAPYCFVIVLMNTRNANPTPAGRCFNGGFNTGGGMLETSSWCIFGKNSAPNVQSTLQHELGHSFGLPHVDVYGYDMETNMSIMSYNPNHHTDGFTPSQTPGILIPEDIRGLAMNKRVFPHLYFDPRTDVPAGYELERVVCLGPQGIPGQPDYGIKATTPSGEVYGSSVERMINGDMGPIMPSVLLPDGKVTYDANTMWHSAESPTGWVTIDLTFPVPAALTRLDIFSQHSGRFHKAQAARLEAKVNNQLRDVVSQDLESQDATLRFPATKAQEWILHLKAGGSGAVVVRGLRFFNGEDEIFPRFVP
jgi:hypothetical protein